MLRQPELRPSEARSTKQAPDTKTYAYTKSITISINKSFTNQSYLNNITSMQLRSGRWSYPPKQGAKKK